jgi:urate oxidase
MITYGIDNLATRIGSEELRYFEAVSGCVVWTTAYNTEAVFLNYFDDRVTNGFVEGMNRAIRLIINRTYGYRNFENFRPQILAQHGDSVPIPH